MNRPYIFCHMMTSLDGKIMGSYMNTKEGENAGNVFYNISFGENPYYKHQGWLSGRVTTDDNFTFYEKPALDEMPLSCRRGILLQTETQVCTMFLLTLLESWVGKAASLPMLIPTLM